MAPALWQAIGLLQMDVAELARFAQAQSRDNPFLKVDPPAGRSGSSAAPRRVGRQAARGIDEGVAAGPSLHEHVSRQIEQRSWAGMEKAVAHLLAEGLAPSGWLEASLDAVARRAGCTTRLVERVLRRLQEAEPAGLFARSLSECLALQLADRGLLGREVEAVLAAIGRATSGDASEIARLAGLPEAEVRRALSLLRTLDPKPGARFAPDEPIGVTPDVLVTRGEEGGWRVDLNRSEMPTIVVDEGLMERARAEGRRAELARLRQAYGSARWVAEAVRRRHETVLAIAAALVRRQIPFVEHGPARLAPLTKREVARQVGLSESTVSRVTRSCWAELPRGTVSLHGFFAAEIPTLHGGVSAPMVQALIRERIAGEDPLRPLSDAAIAAWLEAQGIALARRTVAKYRAGMGLEGRSGRGAASRPPAAPPPVRGRSPRGRRSGGS